MSIFSASAGPSPYGLMSKETVPVILATNHSATKGDMISIIPAAGEADKSLRQQRSHWISQVSLVAHLGNERIWGVCMDSGVSGDWINVQVTGMASVNCVGQYSDKLQDASVDRSAQMGAPTDMIKGVLSGSTPLYICRTGERVLAQTFADATAVRPAAGAAGTADMMLTGLMGLMKEDGGEPLPILDVTFLAYESASANIAVGDICRIIPRTTGNNNTKGRLEWASLATTATVLPSQIFGVALNAATSNTSKVTLRVKGIAQVKCGTANAANLGMKVNGPALELMPTDPAADGATYVKQVAITLREVDVDGLRKCLFDGINGFAGSTV